MHVCIVYDCLYPWTIGGAERWYRSLAEELVARGHRVTYLTRRQWRDDEGPDIVGVQVVAVSKEEPLYGPDGRRRIGEAIRFGAGVLRHLLAHRRRYDVVHTCSFPYFSLLAARVALTGTRTTIGVDWFEVWSAAYWRGYLGGVGGAVGRRVQRLCVRVSPRSFVFSDLHRRRLVEEGATGAVIRLAGLHEPESEGPRSTADHDRDAVVVFAGRHIAEKRAHVVPGAIAAGREHVVDLRAVVFGDGPERARVLAEIDRHDAGEFVRAPGFVDRAEIIDALSRAACMVLPSSREGYGLVVIEAAAAGTPSVVVAGDDNAAAELVVEGVNGHVAPSVDALADAIVAAVRGGAQLRERTRRWYAANAGALAVGASVDRIIEEYEASAAPRPHPPHAVRPRSRSTTGSGRTSTEHVAASAASRTVESSRAR